MKLTDTQQQTIETYLLSWKLQFRDFYDEMFDHFCSEIEERMKAGKAFDEAFSDTSYLFSGHEYEPKAVINLLSSAQPRYFGPKAFEMEWYAALLKSNSAALFRNFIDQFTSLKIEIWAIVYFALYIASTTYSLPNLWLFALLIPFIFRTVSMTFLIAKDKAKFRFINLIIAAAPDGKRHEEKSTLHGTKLTFVHQLNFLFVAFGFLLNFHRIYFDHTQLPLWVGCGITLLFSAFVVAQFQAIKKSNTTLILS